MTTLNKEPIVIKKWENLPYDGLRFFVKERSDGKFNIRYALNSSNKLTPDNGWYTTKDIARNFIEYLNLSTPTWQHTEEVEKPKIDTKRRRLDALL